MHLHQTQMDAIENMVATGWGLITVGNGRMVIYGPMCPEMHRPGIAFIDNRNTGPTAVRYIREAIEALHADARKAKVKSKPEVSEDDA